MSRGNPSNTPYHALKPRRKVHVGGTCLNMLDIKMEVGVVSRDAGGMFTHDWVVWVCGRARALLMHAQDRIRF